MPILNTELPQKNVTSKISVEHYLEQLFPNKVWFEKKKNMDLYFLTKPEYLSMIIPVLRDNTYLQCKQFVDICAVDWLFYTKHKFMLSIFSKQVFGFKKNFRFEIIYQLLSVRFSQRIFIKIYLADNAIVESLTQFYHGAGWCERELWDMFGIFVVNHADLRRVLCDYGFEGHPLRKDFPVSGFVELEYNSVQKRVMYQSNSFMQEYRGFQYKNPWKKN